MHKGHYAYSYYVLAMFLGRFARSIATISVVFRVCVKLIIDPFIDHLIDNPMGRNPKTLVHVLGALHPRSGVAIRQLLSKLQSSPDFKWKGARICDTFSGCLKSITSRLFEHHRLNWHKLWLDNSELCAMWVTKITWCGCTYVSHQRTILII